MIKFHNQVPSVYIDASRDFQYLSWLINVVLNSVKHNVDDMYNLPCTDADPKLIELLAMTLGFKIRHNYDKNQLAALTAALPHILRNKGTDKAVIMAGNALITAAGAVGDCECKMLPDRTLEVLLPNGLVDITLFTDLLPYILPAGLACRVVKRSVLTKTHTTELEYNDIVYTKCYADVEWDTANSELGGSWYAGQAPRLSYALSEDPIQPEVELRWDEYSPHFYEGLGGLFGGTIPVFNNYEEQDGNYTLNPGTMDNTFIPGIDTQHSEEVTGKKIAPVLSIDVQDNNVIVTSNQPDCYVTSDANGNTLRINSNKMVSGTDTATTSAD